MREFSKGNLSIYEGRFTIDEFLPHNCSTLIKCQYINILVPRIVTKLVHLIPNEEAKRYNLQYQLVIHKSHLR